MGTCRWFPVALAIALVGHATGAAAPAPCNLKLTVELTPDVPDPTDSGFLSSLLDNHPEYELTLDHQVDATIVVLNLSGPGPDSLCKDVVDTMRKDGRVLSVKESTQ